MYSPTVVAGAVKAFLIAAALAVRVKPTAEEEVDRLLRFGLLFSVTCTDSDFFGFCGGTPRRAIPSAEPAVAALGFGCKGDIARIPGGRCNDVSTTAGLPTKELSATGKFLLLKLVASGPNKGVTLEEVEEESSAEIVGFDSIWNFQADTYQNIYAGTNAYSREKETSRLRVGTSDPNSLIGTQEAQIKKVIDRFQNVNYTIYNNGDKKPLTYDSFI